MSKRSRTIILSIAGAILVAAAIFYFLVVRVYRVPTGAMANTILPGNRIVTSRIFGEIKRGDLIALQYPKDTSVVYVERVIGLPGETIECKRSAVLINGEALPEHRIFVENPINNTTLPLDPTNYMALPLKVVRDEGAVNGARWKVYYYNDSEDFADDGPFLETTYGVTGPFRIPKKGDPILDQIKNEPGLRQVYDADNDGLYDSDQYFCMGDNRDNSEDSRYWGTVPYRLITGKVFWIY